MEARSIILIEGQRSIVALPFVVGQCFLRGSSSRQSCINGFDDQFHITKGIHDALYQVGILVVAGVAHQRPPGPYGLRKKLDRSAVPQSAPLACPGGRARQAVVPGQGS